MLVTPSQLHELHHMYVNLNLKRGVIDLHFCLLINYNFSFVSFVYIYTFF